MWDFETPYKPPSLLVSFICVFAVRCLQVIYEFEAALVSHDHVFQAKVSLIFTSDL